MILDFALKGRYFVVNYEQIFGELFDILLFTFGQEYVYFYEFLAEFFVVVLDKLDIFVIFLLKNGNVFIHIVGYLFLLQELFVNNGFFFFFILSNKCV